MKQQYETAMKRIREESELKNKFEQELHREQQKLQDLSIQHEQQQKVLKLKSEGLAAAQRKLRHVSNGNQNEALTNWEVEMERLLTERKELEMLRNDVEKRKELIEKRESLLRERTELETRKVSIFLSFFFHREKISSFLENEQKSSNSSRRIVETKTKSR